MRTARYNGQLVEARADAPRRATCPACGGQVALRKNRHGGWDYYHIPDSLDESHRDCPLWRPSVSAPRDGDQDRQLSPEYALALAMIRCTILDALDGTGIHLLGWLYCDVAQAGLRWLLGTDVETTLEVTRKTVDRLAEITAVGQGEAVRQTLARRGTARLRELVWGGTMPMNGNPDEGERHEPTD